MPLFVPTAEQARFVGNKSITGSLTIGADVVLQREAANVLAQKNATAAQDLRVYNTDDGAGNYERADIGWNNGFGANVFGVGVGAGGSGASRTMVIGTNGGSSGGLSLATAGVKRWSVSASQMFAQANYDLYLGQSALATAATTGFLGVNSCAGPPTGVPASVPTGQIPLVWDSTNLRLYAYSGAAWHLIQAT